MTLDLYEDGAFVFVSVQKDAGATTVRGTWTIGGTGSLSLLGEGTGRTGAELCPWHGFATEYWGPTKSPAGFALFGGCLGCDDEDNWEPLHWEGAVPASVDGDKPVPE